MGIDGVDVFTARMAHERFADFLHDACFHKPRVERVTEVMETVVADARAADGSLPSGLDDADRLTLEGEEQALLLAFGLKEIVDAGGKGNLPPLASGGFRTRDKEQIAIEVDVLPELAQELAPAHAGIERHHDDGAEMGSGCGKQLRFLIKSQDRSRFPPFRSEMHPFQRVCGEKSFVDCPKQDVPQGFEIPVDSGVSNGLCRMTALAVVHCHRLVNSSDGRLAPIRQQEFQSVDVPILAVAFGEEKCREFAESHLGTRFRDLVALQVEFFPEALLDCRCLSQIGGSG